MWKFHVIFANGREVRGSGYTMKYCEAIMKCIRSRTFFDYEDMFIDGGSVSFFVFDFEVVEDET